MTYPRSHLVDPEGGVYHVCSRCVRRAFLCGTDQLSGYNFDHRKEWLENRILQLSDIFAIDLYGYAVMSNHFHLIANLTRNNAQTWSHEEIAEKWITLTPRQIKHPHATILRALRKRALVDDPERLEVLRERLCSLSWFMRFLNEPLARMANAEDGCKGRFWEGRFKSQRLLDENAVLACMVYVDLNPVRAGVVEDARKAEHTSLARRIKEVDQHERTLVALNQPRSQLPFTSSLASYIELTRWTQRSQHAKRPTRGPPGLGSDAIDGRWLDRYLPKPGCWQRAIGSATSLRHYAAELGQCWIRTASVRSSG